MRNFNFRKNMYVICFCEIHNNQLLTEGHSVTD